MQISSLDLLSSPESSKEHLVFSGTSNKKKVLCDVIALLRLFFLQNFSFASFMLGNLTTSEN